MKLAQLVPTEKLRIITCILLHSIVLPRIAGLSVSLKISLRAFARENGPRTFSLPGLQLNKAHRSLRGRRWQALKQRLDLKRRILCKKPTIYHVICSFLTLI